MTLSRSEDERFMRRALALAARGRLTASPNPMVGALLVRRGRIVAEGYHHFAGRPHAEVLALRRFSGTAPATLYVSLEPCAHHGKTPPCVEAILAAPVSRVVAALRDPDPRVRGKGIAILRAAGREVVTGVLEEEARFLNRMYFHFQNGGLPYVIVKWAATLDGRIADRRGRSEWITSEEARTAGKRIREEVDAVLVGMRTVHADNPRLARLREHPPRSPLVKVVLDPRGRLSPRARLFDGSPVIWMTSPRCRPRRVPRGARVLTMKPGPRGFDPREILERLAGEGIRSVLVEGGGKTVGHFLRGRCAQEAVVFFAPKVLGDGVPAVAGLSLPLAHALDVEPFEIGNIGSDLFLRGRLCSQA